MAWLAGARWLAAGTLRRRQLLQDRQLREFGFYPAPRPAGI
jgi:hypothetical protein